MNLTITSKPNNLPTVKMSEIPTGTIFAGIANGSGDRDIWLKLTTYLFDKYGYTPIQEFVVSLTHHTRVGENVYDSDNVKFSEYAVMDVNFKGDN